MNERDSKRGWNGTCVMEGEAVTLRDKHSGRGTRARVVELGEPGEDCLIEIVRVTPHTRERYGLRPGQQMHLGPWWLEGEPMH